jgi:hypothetical protein
MPGANPPIVIYNVSALKIYNATSSLVSFESKNILFDFFKTLALLHVVVHSEVGGLYPVVMLLQCKKHRGRILTGYWDFD